MRGFWWRFVALGLCLLWLSSCGPTGGDGAGGGGSTNLAGGGIGGTGISFGQITGFGSIIINGIEFDPSGGSITADDNSVTEAELGIGDVCLVEGTINQSTATGSASRVVCNDSLEGPVTDISNVADGVIVVMGKTVQIDTSTPTTFDGFNALSDLAVGQVVEVHGFIDVLTEEVQATRIELKAASFTPDVTEVEIKGRIANFNGSDQFTIDSLTVQTTTSTEVKVSGGMANGKFVEVKGTLNATATILTARKVEDKAENPLADAEDGAEVEVEGLVSNFNGLADFTVNGVPVDASSAEIEGGTVAAFADGVKVEVEGKLDNTGTLIAEKMEIKRRSDIRIEANVMGTPTATSFEVEVGSALITVNVNTVTEIDDEGGDGDDEDKDDDELSSLTSLMAGERVKIRAFQDAASGDIIATRVEREGFDKADDDVKLRGPIEAANDPIITIAGIDIDTSGFSNGDFEDHENNAIGRTAFFNALNADPSREVKVVDEGLSDGTFDKTELED